MTLNLEPDKNRVAANSLISRISITGIDLGIKIIEPWCLWNSDRNGSRSQINFSSLRSPKENGQIRSLEVAPDSSIR